MQKRKSDHHEPYPCKQPLRIDTSNLSDSGSLSSPSSLFSQDVPTVIAHRTAPLIPGLYFKPEVLIPQETANSVLEFCMNQYFTSPNINQVMLFGRGSTGIPEPLQALLSTLSDILHPVLPPETHELLFPAKPERSRQAILNLYQPGEGISAHVDLLDRFGDGIVGVSLGSGCVMQFTSRDDERYGIYLPARSVIVLSDEVRYDWTHEIEKKLEDWVQDSDGPAVCIPRQTRTSITFRWLLRGAEIVGGE